MNLQTQTSSSDSKNSARSPVSSTGKASTKCCECDNLAKLGRKRCEEHLAKLRVSSTKWRKAKLAQGLCVACGREPLFNKNYCEGCSRIIAYDQARRYKPVPCGICKVPDHNRKNHPELGLCWRCPKKAVMGLGLCKEHEEARKQKHRDHSSRIQKERLKKGLCIQCGRKPDKGRRRCRTCLDYQSEYQFLRRGV